MVQPVAVGVFGNIGIDQPNLPVTDFGITFLDAGLTRAKRLHLGTLQGQPGFERLLDMIIVVGFFITDGWGGLFVAHNLLV